MKRLALKSLNYLSNIKTAIFTLFILLISSGCFSSKAKIESIPNWYLNTPQNTASTIYGVGEGSSLEDAKSAALNSMSSRLVVSVGSSLQKLTTSGSDGSYSKSVTQDIKVDVEKIQYTNAKVEKNALVGGNYYVLMSVDRVELFNEKKKSFFVDDGTIDTTFKDGKDLPELEKIYLIKNLSPKIIDNRKKAFVLYAINNSFDYAPYFNKYDAYLSQIDKLKSELQISVNSNEESKFFMDIIVQMLNEDGYKVVKNSSNVQIDINNKIRYSEYKGWKIAKVSTTIGVSSRGKKVSNKTVETTGRSSSINKNALQNAAQFFKQKLEKDGFDPYLFGN